MKGIKKEITKESFNKSTLKGSIRKGFISKDELNKSLLTSFTQDFISKEKRFNKDCIFFVRDKNLCFVLDSKDKTIYNILDCKLNQYIDYIIKKNKDWQVVNIESKAHPDDLHTRGLGVDKIASVNNFTL